MLRKLFKFFYYLINDPNDLFQEILKRLRPLFSERQYLCLMYRLKMGAKLDLDNPKTFSEKLQWLKLYSRKPEYTTMVDKYAVKDYIAKIIGEKYIIPTYGVWETFDDIDWDSLPNQFVLKTTHGGGGGGVVIVKDKSSLDKEKANEILQQSMAVDIYKILCEWPYKNVPKRIIAEKFIVPEINYSDKELFDYKFFCFNGKVQFFKVDFNRFQGHRANYFSPSGTLLAFGEEICPPDYSKKIELPQNLCAMISLAEKISADIPFLRVDFYSINNNIYFGEATFFPASGMGKFTDCKWDKIIGDYLILHI